MFFSEVFNVKSTIIAEYGAVDISLVCDTPLFIDPMLIFNSNKKEYKQLHDEIIRYFHFLYMKSQQNLSRQEVDAWFNFSEVPNNWLGYSLYGNKGLALGKKYADFLCQNVGFAMQQSNITKSIHIEKVMLLYEGSGKDKISDLTVNLIKHYLCEYTEKFAKKHIAKEKRCKFPVDKAFFNYDTESFISKEYDLPFVINEKGNPEYVLLTPRDILRSDEPAINRDDFIRSHSIIRESIDNSSLRAFVNNYISKAVLAYEEKQKKNKKAINEKTVSRIEKKAFEELTNQYPELYDYYIKLLEDNPEKVIDECNREVNDQIERLELASKNLLSIIRANDLTVDNSLSAREEAKYRLRFFKHVIEDCDGYKCLYVNNVPVAKENDLQRLFRFVWYGSNYKVDAEPNNGRGQADFIVSYGQKNQNIVEFKLASNSNLSHVFQQVQVYEAANCCDGSLIAIFYFSESEYQTAMKVVKDAGYEHSIDESIFLIDSRNDNKTSASKV